MTVLETAKLILQGSTHLKLQNGMGRTITPISIGSNPFDMYPIFARIGNEGAYYFGKNGEWLKDKKSIMDIQVVD